MSGAVSKRARSSAPMTLNITGRLPWPSMERATGPLPCVLSPECLSAHGGETRPRLIYQTHTPKGNIMSKNLVSAFRALAVDAVAHAAALDAVNRSYITAARVTTESGAKVREITTAATEVAKEDKFLKELLPTNSNKVQTFEAVVLIDSLKVDPKAPVVLFNVRGVIAGAVKRLGIVDFREFISECEDDDLTQSEVIDVLTAENGKGEKVEPKDKDIAALLKAAQGPVTKAKGKREKGEALTEEALSAIKALQDTLSALLS